jgi:tRNA pseudouridine38-40 synthase
MRLAVGIEYDGTAYAGWQAQATVDSVERQVQQALAAVANHAVEVTCAGRTDAGVHALCQVAHFDASVARSERAWVLGANTHLPVDIALLWARPVPQDFHARYSASARSYRYVIVNRPMRPALARLRAHFVHHRLDERAMNEAARFLLGEHDFSSFRSSECQSRTPVRRVDRIGVARQSEFVLIEVTANAFLHHMVRNIAGVLLRVGLGEAPAGWVRDVLGARDRTSAGVTAPPQGLYLQSVSYPAQLGLPAGVAVETGLSSMIPPHVLV